MVSLSAGLKERVTFFNKRRGDGGLQRSAMERKKKQGADEVVFLPEAAGGRESEPNSPLLQGIINGLCGKEESGSWKVPTIGSNPEQKIKRKGKKGGKPDSGDEPQFHSGKKGKGKGKK